MDGATEGAWSRLSVNKAAAANPGSRVCPLTNYVLFCQTFTVKENCKKCFLQKHYQGLCLLFSVVMGTPSPPCTTQQMMSLNLFSLESNAKGEVEGP